jgi:hypothetical protein
MRRLQRREGAFIGIVSILSMIRGVRWLVQLRLERCVDRNRRSKCCPIVSLMVAEVAEGRLVVSVASKHLTHYERSRRTVQQSEENVAQSK